jgi:UDP-N-acetylglucosamine acyltransferase
MNIHPTAIVSQRAQLAADVEIGPYSIIEADVHVSSGTKIYSHVHILKKTKIGENCQIHMGAILGHIPQMRQKSDLTGRLIIGQRNIFREYTTVHCSTQESAATTIGNDNYFMAFSHIAHDCCIGNNVTICNGTLIAGHTIVEDNVFISGNVTVHQFCRIGRLSMIGGLARVAKDVPPYMLVKGNSTVWSINSVGLRRAEFSGHSRQQIKQAFKLLYKSGLNLTQAIERLQKEQNSGEVKQLINFIQKSQRGICGYKRPTFWKRIHYNNFLIKCKKIPAYQLFQSNKSHECQKKDSIVYSLKEQRV